MFNTGRLPIATGKAATPAAACQFPGEHIEGYAMDKQSSDDLVRQLRMGTGKVEDVKLVSFYSAMPALDPDEIRDAGYEIVHKWVDLKVYRAYYVMRPIDKAKLPNGGTD